jgi:hypothetical protein
MNTSSRYSRCGVQGPALRGITWSAWPGLNHPQAAAEAGAGAVSPSGQRRHASKPIPQVLIGRDRQIRFLGVEQRRRDREVRECDLGPDQVGLLREVGSSTRASRLKDSMPFATTAISGGPKLRNFFTSRSMISGSQPSLSQRASCEAEGRQWTLPHRWAPVGVLPFRRFGPTRSRVCRSAPWAHRYTRNTGWRAVRSIRPS